MKNTLISKISTLIVGLFMISGFVVSGQMNKHTGALGRNQIRSSMLPEPSVSVVSKGFSGDMPDALSGMPIVQGGIGGSSKVQSKRRQTPVVDYEADVVKQVKTDTIIRLVGNVVFHHNGAIIQCDSALRYNDKRMDCFGNVLINKDSTNIYGDKASYDGNRDIAIVYAPLIKITNGEETVMYTYELTFNTYTSIGEFDGGGIVIHRDNFMESQRGLYNSDINEVTLYEDVSMRNLNYKIKTDSLKFNLDNEITTFLTTTYIWDDERDFLTSESGNYNHRERMYTFTEKAYLLTPDNEVWADSLIYQTLTKEAFMQRNVQILDTAQRTLAFGDWGYYNDSIKKAILTREPSVRSWEEDGDTMYLRGDSIYFETFPRGTTKPDSAMLAQMEREMQALAQQDTQQDSVISGVGPDENSGEMSELMSNDLIGDSLLRHTLEGGVDTTFNMGDRQIGNDSINDSLPERIDPEIIDNEADAVEVLPETTIDPPPVVKDKKKTQKVKPVKKERRKKEKIVKSGKAEKIPDTIIDSLVSTSIQEDTVEYSILESVNKALIDKSGNPILDTMGNPVFESIAKYILDSLNNQVLDSTENPIIESIQKLLVDSVGYPVIDSLGSVVFESIHTIKRDELGAVVLDSLGGVVIDHVHTLKIDSVGKPALDSLGKFVYDRFPPLVDTALLPQGEKQDSVERLLRVFRNVKSFHKDFQMICDSLVGYSVDSTATLFGAPVLWNENNQITADEQIDVYTKDEKMDWADFIGSPFVVQMIDSIQYNQAKSRTMQAYFKDNEIEYTHMQGNVLNYYYWQDDEDDEVVGFLRIECSEMIMNFMDRNPSRMKWMGQADWVIFPIEQIPEEQPLKIENFKWISEVRAQKPEDVCRRIEKMTKRIEVEGYVQPEFEIETKILTFKKKLIEGGTWRDRSDKATYTSAYFTEEESFIQD